MYVFQKKKNQKTVPKEIDSDAIASALRTASIHACVEAANNLFI